jgi:hypothetical protein
MLAILAQKHSKLGDQKLFFFVIFIFLNHQVANFHHIKNVNMLCNINFIFLVQYQKVDGLVVKKVLGW